MHIHTQQEPWPLTLVLRPALPLLPAQDAEKEEYEEKLKEVQDVCAPIVGKHAGAAGGAPEGGEGDEDLAGDHDEL